VTNASPVTFPVLDAFFADEDFARELKDKLGLNDDQINRLRNAAREKTAKLREDAPRSGTGSTAQATKLADQEVKAIIGEDKAKQLYALIQERWGGEPPAIAAARQPNAKPTDTRIVVNIPAYRMDLFQNGNLVKSYKVGIGYPEFPLPTGMRKAETVIFNPTWTPPDEPWVESSNKVKPGQKIAAGDKLNPLGPAKIPIGLPSLIHGGKQPAKIGGFASHGCVGLTTPQLNEFIPILSNLAGSQISETDVTEYEKEKTDTKKVKLNQAVPVELRYETIVVQNGALHIFRDVYDKDTNTDENLENVLAAYGVTPDQLNDKEKTKIADALTAMSRDANGKSTEPQTNSSKTAREKLAKNKDGSPKITRSVKGEKEVIIEVAALNGKGYPEPVQLNDGGAPKRTGKASKQARKK
jgi:lipoprotein-anchoring transpeptidase ErfK/SrfK